MLVELWIDALFLRGNARVADQVTNDARFVDFAAAITALARSGDRFTIKQGACKRPFAEVAGISTPGRRLESRSAEQGNKPVWLSPGRGCIPIQDSFTAN